MGHRVSWRAWAVILCFQLAVVVGEDLQVQQNDIGNDEFTENMDNIDTDLMARGKKKKKYKYVMPILLGVILMKTMLLPLVLKAMAILSGKAFLLSKLSLILASLLGLKKTASHGWDRVGHYATIKDRGDPGNPVSYQPVTEHMPPVPQFWARRDFHRK